jgi:hypothetical protein
MHTDVREDLSPTVQALIDLVMTGAIPDNPAAVMRELVALMEMVLSEM